MQMVKFGPVIWVQASYVPVSRIRLQIIPCPISLSAMLEVCTLMIFITFVILHAWNVFVSTSSNV